MQIPGSIELTSDENRLVRFFRCLSPEKRFEVLYEVGSKAVEEFIPDSEISNFSELMPKPSSLHGFSWGNIYEPNSMAHLLYCAISETGEPDRSLLGTSLWDEDEAIPRFCYGANRESESMGSKFDCDRQFAEDYLTKWRFAIVAACEDAAPPNEEYDA